MRTNDKLFIYLSGCYNDNDGYAIIKGNLGDMIGYYIIKHLILKNNLDEKIQLIPINQKTPQNLIKNANILTLTGSIINHVPRLEKNNKVTIIGLGNINGDVIKINNNTNILGVRGNLTKNSLIYNKDVQVISDPGILISDIYIKNEKPKKDIGFIIHSVDREFFFKKYPHLIDNLINNYQSPNLFINELLNYEKIVSSSLHGIIFSHSFNKPVIPIKITDKIIGGDYKYTDYYTSLGFDNVRRVDCNDDVINFNLSEKISTIMNVNSITKIKENQLRLITKFLTENYG